LEEEKTEVVNIESPVEGTETRGIDCFWWAYPLGQGIGGIQFAEQLGHSEISEFELNPAWLRGIHLVPYERSEDIPEMDVLMGKLVKMQVVNGLGQAPGYWH
jgi:hypothetical protein